MKTIDEIVSNSVTSFTGSKTTQDMVKKQIENLFGKKAIEDYNPYTNCRTFASWLKLGYKPKKGSRSIKSITYIQEKDENGKPTGNKIKRTVHLFFITQVEPLPKYMIRDYGNKKYSQQYE